MAGWRRTKRSRYSPTLVIFIFYQSFKGILVVPYPHFIVNAEFVKRNLQLLVISSTDWDTNARRRQPYPRACYREQPAAADMALFPFEIPIRVEISEVVDEDCPQAQEGNIRHGGQEQGALDRQSDF